MPIDTQEDIETLVSATRRFGDDLQSSTGERNPCGFCERGQKSPIETVVSAWVQQPRKYTGGQGLAIGGGRVVPEPFSGWRTHDSPSGGESSPIETRVSAWVDQPRKYTGGQGLAICGGSVVPEAFCGWRTHDSVSGGRSGSGERSSSEWEDQPSECVWSDVDLAHTGVT